MKSTFFEGAALWLAIAAGAWCQTIVPSPPESQPIYQVTVVSRTLPAVNYERRGGPTQIDFQGTVLLPKAKGMATIESKGGRGTLEGKFENLTAPTQSCW